MFSVYQLPVDYRDNVMVDQDGCWVWLGGRNSNGYATQGGYFAHRTVFEVLVGRIPKGMTLDHLCRRPPCINPNHLEIVTRGENTRRIFNHVPYTSIDHVAASRWGKDFTEPDPGPNFLALLNLARRRVV